MVEEFQANREAEKGGKTAPSGAQTLLRGLSILEHVSAGATDARSLAALMALPRSTVHRMLKNLVEAGYLHNEPYHGYSLGHKLMRLGAAAMEQRPFLSLARPHLNELAERTEETIHFGVREGFEALYLEKISSPKAFQMRSTVGQRMPLGSTGLGRALLLDEPSEVWKEMFDFAIKAKKLAGETPLLPNWETYAEHMFAHRARGWVMDLEENEIGVRCVAAPVRGVNGGIVASVSLASLTPYMDKYRMLELGPQVKEIAEKISRTLGCSAHVGFKTTDISG